MTPSWTPISVIVPSELRSKCGKFGYDIVQHIKANRMNGRFRINPDYLDVTKQAMSKVGECAGAMACGVDPNDLDWDHTRMDPGYDFLLQTLKVDVKSTVSAGAKHLIYPCDKTQDFDRHNVDVFLMVWMAGHKDKNFGYCEARGWSFKDEFLINKHIVTKADWKVYRMTPGTWALPQAYLMPMGVLMGREWRDASDLRRAVLGWTTPTAEERDAERGNGKMEGRLGEQTVSSGVGAAGNRRVPA